LANEESKKDSAMRSLRDVAETAGEVARPFWTAMLERRIEIPFCDSCGRAFFYPRRFCPHCHSAQVSWIQASGRGVVFAATVIHVPFPGIQADDIPLAAGLVDLAEGIRIPARFVLQSLPKVGDAVIACFRDGFGGFPVFLSEGAGA
jgi:uncharacterized OB-fold protein